MPYEGMRVTHMPLNRRTTWHRGFDAVFPCLIVSAEHRKHLCQRVLPNTGKAYDHPSVFRGYRKLLHLSLFHTVVNHLGHQKRKKTSQKTCEVLCYWWVFLNN